MPDSASHLLARLIQEKNVIVEMPSEDRDSVVKSLIHNLVETGRIAKTNAAVVSRLVNERDALGTTAMGSGVAIPHARIGFSDAPIIAFALLRKGEGFNALDGAPVRFVFLTLTPKENQEAHLDVMKTITAFAKKPTHLKALSGCKSGAEVCGVFRDYA